MSAPTRLPNDEESHSVAGVPGLGDTNGRLPRELLECAESLLDSVREARLAWLVGLPGSGKSTLLEACRVVDPGTRIIELAQELTDTGYSEGPPRPGGLQALGAAAGRVRERCAHGSARTIVATTGVPIESVPCVPDERLLVIAVDSARAEQQLRSRPPRAARSATPEEMAMHGQHLERIKQLPHAILIEVPVIPLLVGRAVR